MFHGGGTKYANDHGAVDKDDVVKKLIPEEVSECALAAGRKPGQPCASSPIIKDIGKYMSLEGTDAEIMQAAAAALGCSDEKCVLGKMSAELGEAKVRHEIAVNIKVRGPTSSRLLSNVHIDSTLRQWMNYFPDFFAYNFNMIDYMQFSYDNGFILHHPDTLATIRFTDLYSGEHDGKKYKCCGCVINSGQYSGRGKHWMALFADARGPAWTVEYFNSAGNAPGPEWISWLEKTKIMMELLGGQPTIVRATSIRHQQSKTECGVYSLFYIWARLHGVPVEYFNVNPVPDQLMFEFRQHLFADPSRQRVKQFDWNVYKNTTKITWEN